MPDRRRAAPLAPEDRRVAIVDAVVPLLLQRGAAVTTKEIAAAAGVAEGTLFSVFDDKRSLILSAIRRRLDPAPLRDALTAIDTRRPLDDILLEAAQLALPRVDEVRTLAAALHGLPLPAKARSADAPRPGRQAVQEWNAALAEGIAALLEPHAATLRRPPQRLGEAFASAILAARPLIEPTHAPFEASELVDHFLHGATCDVPAGGSPC